MKSGIYSVRGRSHFCVIVIEGEVGGKGRRKEKEEIEEAGGKKKVKENRW